MGTIDVAVWRMDGRGRGRLAAVGLLLLLLQDRPMLVDGRRGSRLVALLHEDQRMWLSLFTSAIFPSVSLSLFSACQRL